MHCLPEETCVHCHVENAHENSSQFIHLPPLWQITEEFKTTQVPRNQQACNRGNEEGNWEEREKGVQQLETILPRQQGNIQ